MGSSSIKVGVFDASRGAAVPQEFVGRTVWYSDIHKSFLITDENNQITNEFDFAQFRKFYDGNVLAFTSPGVQAHMEHELIEHEKKNALSSSSNLDPFADDPFLDDGYQSAAFGGDNEYQPLDDGNTGGYEYNTEIRGRRASNRRDATNTGQNAVDETGQRIKDPTKHIGAFFAITLIIAVVVFITLNFAEPIVTAVAPLLN